MNTENNLSETQENLEKATFSGGCFWCMEGPFEKHEGVHTVFSGYSGGEEKNPTYKQVSSGSTDHAEAIQVLYNPEQVSYSELLDIFWRQIDPTDAGGQFVDRGKQYRSAIFYHGEEQKELAEESKEALEKSKRYDTPIVTEIVPFEEFYPAEEYHQDYYKKNPIRYRVYRSRSGRDEYLEKTWGKSQKPHSTSSEQSKVESQKYSKPSDEELREMLTPLQYKVTQEDGTEQAFDNEYVDNEKEGIYVDVVSGEPLFSSTHKYDSKTGWPSFWQPLDSGNIVEKEDRKLFSTRTEIRSQYGDSHLGHVFPDGPEPTGLRYCINSAALRFVPKEDLDEEGYGEYMGVFEKE